MHSGSAIIHLLLLLLNSVSLVCSSPRYGLADKSTKRGRKKIAMTNQIIISVSTAVISQNNTTLLVLKNDSAMVLDNVHNPYRCIGYIAMTNSTKITYQSH